MFKYLIRLFTVFSLLFPVVTHAIVSPSLSILGECSKHIVKNDNCATFSYAASCYLRPSECVSDSATCTPTEGANCYVLCIWKGCSDDSEPTEPCEKGYWLNGECVACPSYASCSGGKIKSCFQGYSLRTVNEVNQCYCPSWKYENLATGKCETCPALLTNGMCIPCPDGQVVNGACVSCPNGLVENGACVDCTKNGKCLNGTFTGCNDSYIKYYGTDGLACVACGDRCMDNSTCPLYGECSTDTSNTGLEFEQCFDGFTMDLNLDAGTVKCQCTGNAYIDSSGQCVACLDNAVCRDEKLTGCKEGFQKLTDEKSGNIIMCAGCTPNGTCSDGVFQYCNDNYYGNKNGCYKCPDFDRLPGKSSPGSNKVIGDCSVTASKDGALGEDERGYFYFEGGTCNATNATTE